ncbi:hypothetical protein [Paenibacillus polymyxa]|uniref:hypothetical protein n=1 Tax=Paenibacillus polymyxa TaxID=1406 RepID=UPI000589E45F|nr:hypothetical protein [Paenibacillus polymyxa]AJE54293.1 hypothetical protein RE92_25250 [Paenibacillus polymyxa]
MSRQRFVSNIDYFMNELNMPDFDFLLIVAVGSRDFIHEDIKSNYNQNKEYYYSLFKESDYFNDTRIISLSVGHYQAIQQFIGLYLHEKSLKKNDLTLKLIKKGFKFISNFVKNNNKIDLYKLKDGYSQYVRNNQFEKTVHSAHIFGIAIYLSKSFNKEIIYDDFDINLINSSFAQIFRKMRFTFQTQPNNDKKTQFMNRYKSMGINKKSFTLPLNDAITAMNNIHKQPIIDAYKGVSALELEEILKRDMKTHPFMKGLNKAAAVLQANNIHPVDLQNITVVNHEKFNYLVDLCLYTLDDDSKEEELLELLGMYLNLTALSDDYNETKYRYLITSPDETYHDLKILKEQYDQAHSALLIEKEQIKTDLALLKDKNDYLQTVILDLERAQSKKDKIIEELILENKQLLKEREYQKHLRVNNLAISNNSLTLEMMAKAINEKKCVIIGGDKKWQDKLMEYLPDSKSILPKEVNLNFDFVSNQDIVIYNEAINSHNIFDKMKASLNSNSTLIYTGTLTNIPQLLSKIYSLHFKSKQVDNLTNIETSSGK